MNYLVIPEAVWLALPWVPLALGALGGLLLAQGLWGARRGWEPRCRRCTHDLRGIAHDARACPECGADLTRANAVDAGRRRVRLLRIALAVVALAGATVGQSLVGNGGVARLRATLVARMPLEDLVLEVLSRGPNAALASAALERALLAAPARGIPSGEFLDALLSAVRRHRQSAPAAGSGLSGFELLASRLDDDERMRLADLAADEYLESGGATRDLLDLARSILPRPGASQVDVWSRVLERIAAAPGGGALLAPEPRIVSATSGDRIELEFRSLLDPAPGTMPGIRGGRGLLRRRGQEPDLEPLRRTIVIERAELRPADPASPTLRLFELAAPFGVQSFGLQMATLLADAPPGKGTLVITGLSVPQSRMPIDVGPAPRLEPDRARGMAGVEAYERSVEIDLAPAVARRLEVSTDVEAIDSMREALARSHVRRQAGWGASVALDLELDLKLDLGQSATASASRSSYAFDLHVEQDGRARERIGNVAGSDGSRSMAGGQLPEGLDLDRPFRIVLSPRISEAIERPTGGPLVWARFALAFDNADATPVATSTPLPDRTGTAFVPLAGPEIEARLRALAAALLSRAEDPSGPSVLTLEPRALWIDGHDEGDGAGREHAGRDDVRFDDLVFCGTFEVRLDDRLVAMPRPWIGPLAGDGWAMGLRLDLVPDAAGRAGLVVRYLPDPTLCPAVAEGELRYVAVPFELEYTTSDGPPVVRFPARGSGTQEPAKNARP